MPTHIQFVGLTLPIMLQRAAEVAGFTLTGHTQKDHAFCCGGVEWRPHEDGTQALELAGKLGLSIVVSLNGKSVNCKRRGSLVLYQWETIRAEKPGAAYAMAIVRAAAELWGHHNREKP